MKKYLYLISFALLLAACSQDDERIFSEPSGVRSARYIDECNTLLKTSAQGWKLVYAPDTTLATTGTYSFLMKFLDGNRVEMASEFADEKLTSSYRIDMSQSAMLIFDSYNYIHELTYPNNNPPNGMSGDFEFIIQNRTDDKLELIGRKKRVRLELVKATDQDWTNLAKQSEIQSNIALKVEGRTKEKWVIALNGAPVQGALAADPLQHTFTITIGATNYTATYAITPDGLVFGKPVALKIGSETVTLNGLSYQSGATDVDRKFISADGSLVFGIETETLYLYEDFIGTYTLRYATSNTATTRTRSATVTVVEEQRGSTYTLNGILADDSPGKLIMRYNANGTVSLLGQIMHVYPDTKYDFWWLPYSKPDNGNFTSRTTTYGQVSVEIEMSADEKLSYNMVDNGVWTSYGGTAGFILRNYNGSTSAGNVNGKDGQYAYFFLRFEMN